MTDAPAPAIKHIPPGVRGRVRRKRSAMVSVPQWARTAGLADDGRSIATARELIAKGDGPKITDTRIMLDDHAAWAESNPWARYLLTLDPDEHAKRAKEALLLVGNVAYVTLLYNRFSASRWQFQMTFEQWLRRRQRLRDKLQAGRKRQKNGGPNKKRGPRQHHPARTSI
jgi:hypothetical protein